MLVGFWPFCCLMRINDAFVNFLALRFLPFNTVINAEATDHVTLASVSAARDIETDSRSL